MTGPDASRIQSSQVRPPHPSTRPLLRIRAVSSLTRPLRSQAKAGGDTAKGSFPARAQSGAAKNANAVPGRPAGGASAEAAAGKKTGKK